MCNSAELPVIFLFSILCCRMTTSWSVSERTIKTSSSSGLEEKWSSIVKLTTCVPDVATRAKRSTIKEPLNTTSSIRTAGSERKDESIETPVPVIASRRATGVQTFSRVDLVNGFSARSKERSSTRTLTVSKTKNTNTLIGFTTTKQKKS